MARARVPSGPLSAARKNTQEPFAEPGDEAGFGHEFQVAADARLALSQNLGQILDVQFGAREQGQDAQARGLARAPQRGKCLIGGKTWYGRAALIVT